MTRGLAVSEQTIYVGASMRSERKNRHWQSGAIWLLDRASLRTTGKIDLPDSGDIHHIRLVDAAHGAEIITSEQTERLRRRSPVIDLGYALRRRYPTLRRNLFPVSQALKAVNLVTGSAGRLLDRHAG